MPMPMKYLCVYHDYYDKLGTLTDRQVGKIMRAALKYSIDGEILPLSSKENLIFTFLKSDIDRMKESYTERCEKNRENAKKRKRSLPNASEMSQEEEKEEYKDKEEDEYEEKDKEEGEDNTPPRPTIYEVLAYKKEIGSNSLATAFFDYYQANGWVTAHGTPISDWRAAFRMWERRENDRE